MSSQQKYRGITSLRSWKDHTFRNAVSGSFIEHWKFTRKAMQNNVKVWSCPLINVKRWATWKPTVVTEKYHIQKVIFPDTGLCWLDRQKEKDFRIKTCSHIDTRTGFTNPPTTDAIQQRRLWEGKTQPV